MLPEDFDDYEPPPPTIMVILPCRNERVPEASVEFLDIAEDFEGRDVLTFRCPSCGEVHTSLRFG